MKRLSVLMAVVFLLMTARVDAHSVSLVAMVSYAAPDQVTVKLVDGFLNPIGGAQVTARAAAPQQAPGRPVAMTEGPAGTYRAQIRTGGAKELDITIEATLNKELFRGNFRFDTGRDSEDVTRPMLPVDIPQQGFNWNLLVYGVAAVVLVGATVVALRRRGESDEE